MYRLRLYIWSRDICPPVWVRDLSPIVHIGSRHLDDTHYEHRYISSQEISPSRYVALLSICIKHSRRWGHPLLWQRSSAPIRQLISDLDGTLTASEGLVEMAALLGKEIELSELTNKAMLGEVPFIHSFMMRTQLIQGISTEQVASIASRIALSHGAEQIGALCREHGISFSVATGAYDVFAKVLQPRLGYSRYIASRAQWDDHHQLIGIDERAIVDAESKRLYALEQGDALHTLCLGDGANDIPMLASSGYALLYPAATGHATTLPPLDQLIKRIAWIRSSYTSAIDAQSRQ